MAELKVVITQVSSNRMQEDFLSPNADTIVVQSSAVDDPTTEVHAKNDEVS